MRILTVNTEYTRGGAARIARTLHGALNASPSHESLFAYVRGPKSQDSQAVRFALQPEMYLHAFITRLTGILRLWDLVIDRAIAVFDTELEA